MKKSSSPAIIELSWGRVRVAGEQRVFKDAKLYPGGARTWDWRETGTRHRPGVQPADVVELLDHGAEAVVFGTGFESRLLVQPATLELLSDSGVKSFVEQSERAVRLYNQLRDEILIGALIHSTC